MRKFDREIDKASPQECLQLPACIVLSGWNSDVSCCEVLALCLSNTHGNMILLSKIKLFRLVEDILQLYDDEDVQLQALRGLKYILLNAHVEPLAHSASWEAIPQAT